MTDDQINIAIAEACGFIPIVEAEYPNRNIWSKLGITYCACDLPNYCHDLNAMQSAVLSQSEQFQEQFDTALKDSGKRISSMEPKEWATIFLLCKRG